MNTTVDTIKPYGKPVKTPPVIEQLIREKGMNLTQAREKIGLATDTFKKYCTSPQTMNGQNREKFSKLLGITIEQMDAICNGKIKTLNQLLK